MTKTNYKNDIKEKTKQTFTLKIVLHKISNQKSALVVPFV